MNIPKRLAAAAVAVSAFVLSGCYIIPVAPDGSPAWPPGAVWGPGVTPTTGPASGAAAAEPAHKPARTAHPRRDARDVLRLGEDAGTKIEKRRAHHAAVAPGLGEAREVDVEVRARREQREAFGERLHDPVFDAVVDHSREVAGGRRPPVRAHAHC